MEKVFKSLRKQTGYSFFYRVNLLQKARPVNLQLKGVTLDEALKNCFEGQPFTYEILNKTVIIKPKEISKNEGQKFISDTRIDLTISGKVISEAGEPLIGVTVVLKGTTMGTSTDVAGRYSMTVPDNGGTIVFSYIGFLTKEVAVENATTVDVTMAPDVKSLEEVVVVGYGTQQKKDITGAVSTIDAKDVGERRAMQVSEALQGSVPGVTVTRNSGAPGATSTIRLRGITTIGENNPLIIIDGVPNDNINNVNPNDIESITVLKDAASAAIYGSRAAAGVILVTTKRAKAGQSSLEYNYEYGVQTPTHFGVCRCSPVHAVV
ncbi:hypothetical protein AAE02nite_39220 [Adhaeribacter aerolatus]|uniref:Secretin/TonB short N-terminal domain-containing protein n=1 Tax=Adhaeribacter aerolatus TaxID=670289 RepID=A0A512B2R5_9BACT|nr:STN domain-containing protein [Adhaeribacter aerolatus]GEO06258.1 hypothetical protein AAE02nite_39220 [Adhaeribacter aerolatus]